MKKYSQFIIESYIVLINEAKDRSREDLINVVSNLIRRSNLSNDEIEYIIRNSMNSLNSKRLVNAISNATGLKTDLPTTKTQKNGKVVSLKGNIKKNESSFIQIQDVSSPILSFVNKHYSRSVDRTKIIDMIVNSYEGNKSIINASRMLSSSNNTVVNMKDYIENDAKKYFDGGFLSNLTKNYKAAASSGGTISVGPAESFLIMGDKNVTNADRGKGDIKIGNLNVEVKANTTNKGGGGLLKNGGKMYAAFLSVATKHLDILSKRIELGNVDKTSLLFGDKSNKPHRGKIPGLQKLRDIFGQQGGYTKNEFVDMLNDFCSNMIKLDSVVTFAPCVKGNGKNYTVDDTLFYHIWHRNVVKSYQESSGFDRLMFINSDNYNILSFKDHNDFYQYVTTNINLRYDYDIKNSGGAQNYQLSTCRFILD